MAPLPMSSTRLVWPGLAGFYAAMIELAYLLLRVGCGLSLMAHGAQKLFGIWGGRGIPGAVQMFTNQGLEPAEPLAWFVAILEFFGGILIAIGLLTRPIAAAAACEFAVIVFHVHWPNGFYAPRGVEFPLLWGLVLLLIAFLGGRKWSADAAIGKEI